MREIELEWLPIGITVTARLVDSGPNRHLADLLWDSLPYNALQNHALVSGHHLYHLVPRVELIYTQAGMKEDRTRSPDGTLFLSQLQHLAIKYGPLSEYIPAAPIGTVIDEHLPMLRDAGRACWQATYGTKEIVEVRVRQKRTRPQNYPLPRFQCDGPAQLQALVDRISNETESVWLQPPQELLDMHRGVIPSGAGSYEQYFTTLVFVNGETRPLGYCALNGLVRISRNEEISLAALRAMTPNFIRTPAEFLGYCGFNKLWQMTQEVLDVLPQVQTKEQYLALIGALAIYANVLNTWNLQYFPWQHGESHKAMEHRP